MRSILPGASSRGEVADTAAQLPQLASIPQRIELAPRVGQPAFRHTALNPDPMQGGRRLDQRQARRHEQGSGGNALLYLWGRALLQGRAEGY